MVAALAALAQGVVRSHRAPDRPHRSFSIHGSVTGPLYPGAARVLDLGLDNRRSFPLLVTRVQVRVRVDRRHRLAGCSARRDFRVRQLPRTVFPIRLPARGTVRLSGLRLHTFPSLHMRNAHDRNQDACKGARLRLRYRGRARRAP